MIISCEFSYLHKQRFKSWRFKSCGMLRNIVESGIIIARLVQDIQTVRAVSINCSPMYHTETNHYNFFDALHTDSDRRRAAWDVDRGSAMRRTQRNGVLNVLAALNVTIIGLQERRGIKCPQYLSYVRWNWHGTKYVSWIQQP
jgi:hypothetical protein